MATVILGIGNTLLSDEGAGVHAMNLLRKRHPACGLRCIDGGTLSFTLASHLDRDSSLIVFDAAELGAAPGSVRVFVDAQMDDFLGQRRRSPHEVGLLDLFDIARLTDSLPRRRALIGIQPGAVDWGTLPGPAVREALDAAVDAAVAQLTAWGVFPVAARNRHKGAAPRFASAPPDADATTMRRSRCRRCQ